MKPLTLITAFVITLLSAKPATARNICWPNEQVQFDQTVPHQYPIEGTWMYLPSPGDNNACTNLKNKLEDFHRIGGNTVLQFGWSLERTGTLRETHPSCMINGMHCIDWSAKHLPAGKTFGKYAQYAANDRLIFDAVSRSVADATVTAILADGTTREYFALALDISADQPTFALAWFDHTTDSACPACSYHDSKERFLELTNELGMSAYIGMPAIPSLPNGAVDDELMPAYLDFTTRILRSYATTYGSFPSFAGMYQALEAWLGWGLAPPSPIGQAYQATADILKLSPLAAKKRALSPYWDVRTSGSFSQNTLEDDIKTLGRQGWNVIAPQDGRGTAKAATFWDYERTSYVLPNDTDLYYSPNYPRPAKTYGDAYHRSTRELYQAAAAVSLSLAAEGHPIALWANIEAFEMPDPRGLYPSCGDSNLLPTNKARIDRQIQMASLLVEKTISFMWDPLFYCPTPPAAHSLLSEIQTTHLRPIPADGFMFTSGGQLGVIVRGYNLAEAGTVFSLSWYDSNWNLLGSARQAAWVNPSYGSSMGRTDASQEVFIPVPSGSTFAQNFWMHVSVSGPSGLTSSKALSFRY